MRTKPNSFSSTISFKPLDASVVEGTSSYVASGFYNIIRLLAVDYGNLNSKIEILKGIWLSNSYVKYGSPIALVPTIDAKLLRKMFTHSNPAWLSDAQRKLDRPLDFKWDGWTSDSEARGTCLQHQSHKGSIEVFSFEFSLGLARIEFVFIFVKNPCNSIFYLGRLINLLV